MPTEFYGHACTDENLVIGLFLLWMDLEDEPAAFCQKELKGRGGGRIFQKKSHLLT